MITRVFRATVPAELHDEFVLVSVWEDEDAIAGFVGPAWSQPYIPAGMEHLMIACSVAHYEHILPE